MPIPNIDWLDPTDEQLIALIGWYYDQVSDREKDAHERVGYASGALATLKQLIERREDWRKQQREEFKDIGRAHRAAKARDAAWEAGVKSTGEL